MSFEDLPPQSPIYPAEAQDYADAALALSREAVGRVEAHMDLPYGADYWQKVDVFGPKVRAPGSLPVLVFAHGGAWTHGYKEWMGLMAPVFTATPALLVSVSYRLAPENRHPVPLLDCIDALAWVHGRIASYGGDPGRIYVGGHSAGGHLYALAALRPDLLARAGLPADVIKGCLPISSQLNLVFDNPPPGSGEERIYTMYLREAADAPSASPLHLIEGSRVPFLLGYGSQDFPRIVRSNLEMAQALARQRCVHEVIRLEGLGHFDTALSLGRADSQLVAHMQGWIRGELPTGVRR
jgi:arylformamidase